MTTALITGASGFVGSALVAHLKQLGLDVRTVGRFANPSEARHELLPNPDDSERVKSILAKVQPHFIFHLAGVVVSNNIVDYYHCNVLYAVNLLSAAATSPSISKIVIIGSAAEYGIPSTQPISEDACCRPLTPYGISKLAQTLHGVSARNVPVVIARLFNVIGPGMPTHFALGQFAKEVVALGRKGGGVLRTGNLDVYRDFVEVHETVSTIARLAELPEPAGRIVNVCSGNPAKLRDLVTSLVSLSGYPISVEIDQTRLRVQDPPIVCGDTRRLAGMGLKARRPNFEAVLGAMLERANRNHEGSDPA